MDELCDRFAALHLGDDAPAAVPPETNHAPPAGVLSDVNAVRHHWAPHFRSDSLTTSKSTLTPPTDKLATSLSQKSTLDQSFLADVRPLTRKLSPKSPLSAFLKDLASPNDCVGHWPPRDPTPEPSPPSQTPQEQSQQPAPLLLTTKFPAGILTPTSQSSNTASPQSNAIEPQRAVPTTSSLSINAVSAFKRFPAIGVPPFTPSPKSDFTTSRPPTPSLPLVPPVLSSSPYLQMPWTPPPTTLTTTTPTSQRSPGSWQEASEGITVFAPSPKAFITAPITSPYPFVYPPQPWTPSAVSKDLFKDTAVVPRRLRSKFTFTPHPPSRRVGQEEFLAMGHGPDCWCDRHKKVREARDLGGKTDSSRRALTFASSAPSHPWDDTWAAEPRAAPPARRSPRVSRAFGSGLTIEEYIAIVKGKPGTTSPESGTGSLQAPVAPVPAAPIPDASPASSPVVTPKITHAPYIVPELEHKTESTSSDEDAVMITPTSEGSDFGFQRLMTTSSEGAHLDFERMEVIEGVPVDSDSDWSDGWTSVSSGLHSQQPISAPTTQMVSDASVQTSTAPVFASPPPVRLPSPPQTPLTQTYQAHVSDIESGSETD